MLPAQAVVLGVASSTHDLMETEEMKKRARDTGDDGSDLEDRRNYIPPVNQSQPQNQTPQPHEPPPPPPQALPYPPSEVGINSLNPEHAARLAAELASAASTNISVPQSQSQQHSTLPPAYVPRMPIMPVAPPTSDAAYATCAIAPTSTATPYLPYGCSPPPGYPHPYLYPQSAQLAAAIATLAQQGIAVDPALLASKTPPGATADRSAASPPYAPWQPPSTPTPHQPEPQQQPNGIVNAISITAVDDAAAANAAAADAATAAAQAVAAATAAIEGLRRLESGSGKPEVSGVRIVCGPDAIS